MVNKFIFCLRSRIIFLMCLDNKQVYPKRMAIVLDMSNRHTDE